MSVTFWHDNRSFGWLSLASVSSSSPSRFVDASPPVQDFRSHSLAVDFQDSGQEFRDVFLPSARHSFWDGEHL